MGEVYLLHTTEPRAFITFGHFNLFYLNDYDKMLMEGYGVMQDLREARSWLIKCSAAPDDPFDRFVACVYD